METIVLSTSLVNSILQYMGSRPYVEVAGFVNAIQREAESQTKAAENSSN